MIDTEKEDTERFYADGWRDTPAAFMNIDNIMCSEQGKDVTLTEPFVEIEKKKTRKKT